MLTRLKVHTWLGSAFNAPGHLKLCQHVARGWLDSCGWDGHSPFILPFLESWSNWTDHFETHQLEGCSSVATYSCSLLVGLNSFSTEIKQPFLLGSAAVQSTFYIWWWKLKIKDPKLKHCAVAGIRVIFGGRKRKCVASSWIQTRVFWINSRALKLQLSLLMDTITSFRCKIWTQGLEFCCLISTTWPKTTCQHRILAS